VILLLLVQLAGGLRPDLSPGTVRPTTREALCAIPWLADDPARVPSTLWETVLTRYGLAWADRYRYLPTLVVPTALGGVVDAANLAPLPKMGEWTTARKHLVEQRVFSELCVGHLHLPEAQQKAGVGWVTSWRIYMAK